MCMMSETKYTKKRPYAGPAMGWKVVELWRRRGWYAPCVWEYRYNQTHENRTVRPGFHIFLNRKDAEAWMVRSCEKILPVSFKRENVWASGEQEFGDGMYAPCVRVQAFRFIKERKTL
jgi:hypothetical protein